MVGRTAILGQEGLRTGEAESELSAPVLGASHRVLNGSIFSTSYGWKSLIAGLLVNSRSIGSGRIR